MVAFDALVVVGASVYVCLFEYASFRPALRALWDYSILDHLVPFALDWSALVHGRILALSVL